MKFFRINENKHWYEQKKKHNNLYARISQIHMSVSALYPNHKFIDFVRVY